MRTPAFPIRLVFVPTLCLAACGDRGDGDDPFGSGGVTATDSGTTGATSFTAGGTSGSASGSGSASTSATATGGGTGVKFDVGGTGDMTAGDSGTGMGCEKIDFLFVVDNSGSMGAYQTSLINSFGPFMDTIFGTVQAQDYQILVVDSDAGEDLGGCEPCPWDSSYCGDYCDIMGGLDSCESVLGAGEVGPYNNLASNMDCGVPGGVRYLTSDLSQQDIKDKFACMAKVGIFGSGGEKPMTAMVEAVTTQVAAGACNDGFLRDDAVLVVTVITDDYPSSNEDDAKSNGSPQAWYDAVVAAKNGDPSHIVMLGILNLENSTCVMQGSAGPGPVVHPTQRFVDFVDLFGTRGIKGDICSQPDFSAFFAEAVGLIDTACDDFVPPG